MKSVPKFENGYQALAWLASNLNNDLETCNMAKEILDKMCYIEMMECDRRKKCVKRGNRNVQ